MAQGNAQADVEAVVGKLAATFGERLTTAQAVREQHGKGFSYHECRSPDAVVFARTTQEVSQIVSLCHDRRVPIVPFGTGTSVEGQLAALQGGVCIDLSQMNDILAVHAEDMDAVVEPGVTRKQLNTYLRDTGLFFPVDPGADASIGGMVSTRASGTNAVRYGTMRENVSAMTVVLPDGTVVRTGTRARKSSMGYDLTKLFIGAEGTLGIITEVTLRLHPVPEATSSAICAFATLEGAVDTVIQTIQAAVPVARMELLDEISIEATNSYSKLNLPVAPTLLMEFHGTPASVREQAEQVGALAAGNGGGDFEWTTRGEEQQRIWQARHDSAYATRAMRPGCATYVTDVCVPISRLAESILAARADLDASFLRGKILGHVGDGNFHVAYLVLPDRPEEMSEAARLTERMVERALAVGGTASGEHGVGLGKMRFMEAEHGSAWGVMHALKQAIDPHGIMNPGKIVRQQARQPIHHQGG